MIFNKKILLLLVLYFFTYSEIFSETKSDCDNFCYHVLKAQKLKALHDYNYVYGEKKIYKPKVLVQDKCKKPVKIDNKSTGFFSRIFNKHKKQNKSGHNKKCKEIDLYIDLIKSFKLKNDFTHPLVSYYEVYYFNHKKNFENALQRSSGYISYIIQEVKKRNMPGEIALLPMIESSYRSSGISRVGATGMWQFMAYTGRNYGLNQTNWYDGRKDFYAATEAALNYLQDLYRQFGDWELAICAYNVGENRVVKEIDKAIALGLEPKFENLNLPTETKNYLPKLIAARNFIIKHDFYDLDLSTLDNPSKFVAINITTPIDLDVVAKLAELDIDDIKELNYGYKIPVVLPGKNRKLILPLENSKKFNDNLKNYDKDKLSNWIAYKVLKKEKVVDIAKKYNISLIKLKYINGLTGKFVSAGRVILIPKNDFLSDYNKVNNYEFNLNSDNNKYIRNKSVLSLEEAEHEIEIKNNIDKKYTRKHHKNKKHYTKKHRSNKSKNKKLSFNNKKNNQPIKNQVISKKSNGRKKKKF